MSKEEAPIGLTVLEKLFGLLLLAIGGITFYATYTNVGSVPALPGLFLAIGIILMIVGILLFISKSEK